MSANMTMQQKRQFMDRTKRRETNKQMVAFNELKANYAASQIELDDWKRKLAEEQHNHKRATAAVEEARNRLAIAQEEIDADPLPEGAQPVARIQARDELFLGVEQLEAALNAQRRASQETYECCTEAERHMFEAEREISRFSEGLEDTVQALKIMDEVDTSKANQVKSLAERRAKRRDEKQREFEEAKAAQDKEMRFIQTKNAAVAKKQQNDTRKRVLKTTEKTLAMAERIKDYDKEMQADRAEAVMELKANLTAVNAELAGQAQRHRKKVAAAEQRLENDKEELLSKGMNPYVEFRKKELAVADAARERNIRESIEEKKRNLSTRIENEELLMGKQEREKLHAAEFEKEFRLAQGRHVIEEKNRDYILSRTAGKMEILDPTGKAARVDPSQISAVPDHSLGLGKSSRIPAKSMKQITHQMRMALRVEDDDLGEYHRLVSGLQKAVHDGEDSHEEDDASVVSQVSQVSLRSQSAPHGGGISGDMENIAVPTIGRRELRQLEMLSSMAGAVPGMDKAAVAVNLGGNEAGKTTLLKVAGEEEGGAVSAEEAAEMLAARSPKYKTNAFPSKFEKDALHRAKDRHRDRIELGTEQIAGGRLFQGDAFVSTPAELEFKDFEVGKTYKKRFTMTNVSYTFNSFKLLELDDEVVDFFNIVFTKPGRMSAGVSCPLAITFTPQINQDIFTEMRFLTETGPVRIPLRCLIKRCAAHVTNAEIDFGDVVVGQKISQALKIRNAQALPSKIRIVPVSDDEEDEDDSADGMGEAGEGDGGKEEEGGVGDSTLDDTATATATEQKWTGAESADAGAGGVGSEPSLNEAELVARVRRVITAVARKKKREYPSPLTIAASEHLAIEGYSSTDVEVVCAPLSVGPIKRKFTVVFEGVKDKMQTKDENGELVTREQLVTVETQGQEVPIYVVEETMDLKCTLYDRIFRRKVVIRNRAKAAYRVMITVDKRFRKYVEVNPAVCFVQARSSQSVNVKFTPMVEMLHKLAHFTLPYEDYENAALVSLPIEIQAVDQELPAFFVVRSIVCASTLRFSSDRILFNKVYVGQSSSQTITIKNLSMLPQRMAFVRMRKEFTVQPNDGFAVLLPNEEIDFVVTFAPQSAINYELTLTVLTSFNDKYNINVVAEGVEPPLKLSTSVVHMRTTGPGERVVESALITNNTPHSQKFEVMQPDQRFSWITVSPAAVSLAPGASCRLEVTFCPPVDVSELDPIDWHMRELSAQSALTEGSNTNLQQQRYDGAGDGEEAAGGEGEDPTSARESKGTPFSKWQNESGWVYASGIFGGIQWVKKGAGKPLSPPKEVEEEKGLEDADFSPEVVAKEENGEGSEAVAAAAPDEDEEQQQNDNAEEKREDIFQDLPREEWGVVGKWNFPLLIKPRRRNPAAAAVQMNNATTSTAGSAAAGLLNINSPGSAQLSPDGRSHTNMFDTLGGSSCSSSSSAPPAPLCLSITTAVTLPQIEADARVLDFGQISLGTRQLKSFKIFNRNYYPIKLKGSGLNAVGPFSMLRPVKEIAAGESRVVIVECLPTQPGLVVEILELSPAEEKIGGHRLGITLRVQGLKPAIELEGLAAPPAKGGWSPRSGLLDFGHTLAMDTVTKTFTVRNKSSFAIDTRFVRIAGDGLPPSQQAQLMDRTASGLPVFSIRPERIRVAQGEAAEIEVIFRPDRGRLHPFREDVDVVIGQTDEVLRVGIIGRAWARQYFAIPANPLDEPFSKEIYKDSSEVEDLLATNCKPTVRAAAAASTGSLNLTLPPDPQITLEFPDPFAADADPSTYLEMDSAEASKAAAGGNKGGKGKGDPGATTVPPGARRQTRKLVLSGIKVEDKRSGTGNATFEILLGEKAKASGLWSLSVDKGSLTGGGGVAATDAAVVEIMCTLKKPRSLGGLFVGSWQSFWAEVVIKGGWFPQGATDEQRIPVELKAYVSL